MPSDFIRCRARQIQRYVRAKPAQPFADLITKKHPRRAANLEKDFALSLSPDDEAQWPSNWGSNSLSLKSFLRCRSWVRLKVPAEPKDDVVDKEVIVIEDSEDKYSNESGDTVESDDDQAQKADDEPEPFAENDINKSNEESGVEQNAAAALMAFYGRGTNDSPVEEIPRHRRQGYQPCPIPRSDRYYAHCATRSAYFTTQESTYTFPQHRPTFAIPSYAPYGMPYPSYPASFAPAVATVYPIVQTPGYYPPPFPVLDGLRPRSVLAYAQQGYEQYMASNFTSWYSRVDGQSHDQEQQHHAPPPAPRGHRRRH
ncbi:hypothetical protein MRS44_016201 [Fusarium solani]|uniref:uncharacterized protein n=1 Tax=Fusarium solani TaxID=169388 RepID=UPI0032C45534|nr:hypothetical protein MRS44_016201 [Fusarium solani]